jgi:hypothetical protein
VGECGPFVTAYYLEARQTGGPMDTIDTILTDIGPYRAAFAASRRSLQEAAGCRQVSEFGLSSMVNADHVDFL